MNNSLVIRKLRDLAHRLKKSFQTIFILSPAINIPPELEKEITIFDFPLPGHDELKELIDNIEYNLKNREDVEFSLSDGEKEKLIDTVTGLTYEETERVLAKSIVMDKKLSAEDINVVLEEKKQIIRKAGLLDYYQTDEKIADIGGLDLLKDWLTKRRSAYTKEAADFGLPWPKGILLLEIPGCGKSLTAKSVSSLWGMPLLRLDMGRLFGSFIGESEENMRQALRLAESIAPTVLWIDEVEKGLSGVKSSGSSDAGTTARVFGSFVTWMQEKTSAVFVVATANDISLLPPELLRKGRFDEIFFVDLPNLEERKKIFQIHIKKRGRQPKNFNLNLLAEKSANYSGSEIEQAIISALFDAFYNKQDLTTEGILRALQETVPLSVTMKEDIDYLRSWAKTRARYASKL